MNYNPANPYFNLAMVRSSAMFFGRTNLLRRLYTVIANCQSVSLVGSRHIGKSSLLWCACLPEVRARFDFNLHHHIFVYLDLREYLHKTCEDFFQAVSNEVISQSRGLSGLTLQPGGKGEDAFSNILDQIAEQGFFPVLLLDAFDNITRNRYCGPEFFAFLRAHATIGKVSYITGSIAPLYEVCHRGIADSPFFNIFYTYTLEELTNEEARELITVPAQKADIPFTEAEIVWVLKQAGRHPFFIQRVCYFLFEEKLLHIDGEIDEKRVNYQAYKDLLPHFNDMWERLSETQRRLIQDEAQQKRGQYREMPELSGSAFFRQFVRDICQAEVFRMTSEELERALDKIDDPKALGETNLRLMKAVSEGINKRNDMPSAVERGIVMRGVLKEAFERLGGSGVRTDMAPDWKYYNILYYRYFRHHLKNEQIAARLQFTSIRQYYRERNKAIEALLHILVKMEHASSSSMNE